MALCKRVLIIKFIVSFVTLLLLKHKLFISHFCLFYAYVKSFKVYLESSVALFAYQIALSVSLCSGGA